MSEPSTKGPRKRHCWECRHRSLVCDSARPGCRRCATAGMACPGYSGVKPSRYKWLAPGTVAARPWKRQRQETAPAPTASARRDAQPTGARQSPGALPLHVLPIESIMFEAAQYFNTRIYTGLLPLTELISNPHVYPISDAMLDRAQTRPQYLQLGVVCMALGHYMAQLADASKPAALIERFYTYRGMAIRALNSALDHDQKATHDILLIGVMSHLLLDAQQGLPVTWRWHLQGLEKLMALRGGIAEISRAPGLEPFLVSVLSIGVIGNTTSPASDLTLADVHMDAIDYIIGCTATSPFHMCPPSLFANIVRINHIRHQMTCLSPSSPAQTLYHDAGAVLSHIIGFDVAAWVFSKPAAKKPPLWQLVGRFFKGATCLYCILSLQDLVGVLSKSQLVPFNTLDTFVEQLSVDLAEAVQIPAIRQFTLWPLIVLGVAAGNCHRSSDTNAAVTDVRAFVSAQLVGLSRDVGTFSPLVAKGVLERFWSSGKNTWDSCFDKPYIFTSRLAVDTNGVP
ncbi:uncharacterized protein B0I36DRAFT_166353 [Microdochium trichocladiopsis]|uniref:Zn(2)-C6 fungal-type domain-containing protein n=1 Tax=Microdochium trichocladiopsis TaxID=1682393 RepID=A0A9P8Y0V3_9PEZI|nr:uncharacterized protein B0I36DRAFT_166353 [Microdochium trichocladiopsis]KAH7025168.1 hypothetical protein B0I36DRAFT_166353 [Microdochium trichocladiopsis]